MMARKKYTPKSFESVGKVKTTSGKEKADTSANIFESMLLSQAFQSLNARQRILYVICKAQYYGKRKPEKDYPEIDQFQGDDKFYLNWSLVQRYGVYRPSMSSNFYADMKALADKGFIEIISSGKTHRKKTIYKFSDRWKERPP